ncbi:MAG: tRNA (adenosine(37)-N6)-threonylcarbamoyltransferase complex ATPase subunit type 1 TsaE [Chloroflexi bacterium]|nr:tRNA (adenosine(37)-N6)-threonylcarbamoyltransferase complex ATPase subunit type 1 TsaE [Chloroflexota bacterium]
MRAMSQTHTTAPATLEVISHSEAETIAFGRRLGALLQPGDLLLLFAPFGAGKTHLTKGIAGALGVDEADVNSPSFVLINEYETARRGKPGQGRTPIYHVDLYRIETPEALATVGLDDVIAGHGIAVIEWAERAVDWFPREHLAIEIAYAGETDRRIVVRPHGTRAAEIVAALQAGD